MTGPRFDIALVAEMAGQGQTISEIAKHIGVCQQTIKNYAERIRLQCGITDGQKKRDLLITRLKELSGQGMTKAVIAREIGIRQCTVANHAKTLGITIRRSNAAPKEPTDRTKKMVTMYQQGVTLEKIGQQFKLTRERVRQLLKSCGITSDDGGRSKYSALKKATKTRSVEARYQLKYGLPYAVVVQLRKDRVLYAYRNQSNSAKARGIDWKLNFASWFAVWQTSGKLHLRGRGKGHYVMSRMSDDGCYELGNVHIQLATENSREAVEQWRGKVKESRGVFCLYPGTKTPWLAKCGKERLGLHETEQQAVAARHAYMTANNKVEHGLGCGLGYTFDHGAFVMQCTGVKHSRHTTAEAARAAYLAAVAEVQARKSAHLADLAPTESAA